MKDFWLSKYYYNNIQMIYLYFFTNIKKKKKILLFYNYYFPNCITEDLNKDIPTMYKYILGLKNNLVLLT